MSTSINTILLDMRACPLMCRLWYCRATNDGKGEQLQQRSHGLEPKTFTILLFLKMSADPWCRVSL